MGALSMKRLRIAWKRAALRGIQKRIGWPRRLAEALLLALLLCLAVGVGHAQARRPALGGSLAFRQPNYQGVIGGPPGARVEVGGFSWLPNATVTLSVAPAGSGCGGVSVGTYSTDTSGNFTAGFLWPGQANQLGAYAVCGTQANNGSALSSNTFSVLASSPPSLTFSPRSIVAGAMLTITGANWVPGPQTLNVVIVPCNAVCNATPVAQATVETARDGTFSQKLTISAGASTGNYYIQAVNSTATLSDAPAQPIQVSGQAAAAGTPVQGIRPTTTATRTTTQGSTDSSTSPPSALSQASSDLKNALLAAGLGLLALLVLIGAPTFFIGRSRGPALFARARRGKETEPPREQTQPSRRAAWRAARQPGVAVHQTGTALAVVQHYQDEEEPAGEEALTPSDDEEAEGQGSGDDYPWEERIPPPPPDF
jgi:hypothetical protein